MRSYLKIDIKRLIYLVNLAHAICLVDKFSFVLSQVIHSHLGQYKCPAYF